MDGCFDVIKMILAIFFIFLVVIPFLNALQG